MERELQVGDVVYQSAYGELGKIGPVDRVTKTMAMVGKYRFKKNVSENGWISEVGGTGFGRSSYRSYYLESASIKEKYLRQTYSHYVKQYAHKLPLEDLKNAFDKLRAIHKEEKIENN